MSSVGTDCCTCVTPTVTEIPGSPGEPGAAGTNGTDGTSCFTFVAEDFAVANTVDTISITVADNQGFVVGQTVFAADPSPGTDHGTFEVISLTGTTVMGIRFMGAGGDTPAAFTIGEGGKITATGVPAALAAALPDPLTDNTEGALVDTLAEGTASFIHSVYFRAAAITGNVLLYTYTPGFQFKIIKISASVVDAITTGSRAATLTTAIAGTPTTGGVVVMSGTYALGAEQASSAVISGLNLGTAVQAITVTASSVTAFAEGGFLLNMQIINVDTADAVASLADRVNDLITALS